MPIDNRCVYMVHVCLHVRCSDCAGVCGNVWCVATVVKDIGFILSWSVEVCCVLCVCVGEVMYVVFSV